MQVFESPIGKLGIQSDKFGLTSLSYENQKNGKPNPKTSQVEKQGEKEVLEFLDGKRENFELPFDLSQVNTFTKLVLEETSKIPYGSVSTYQEIAKKIGKPGAARAVGNALGRNPLPIIIPCHRVVAANGKLGGYTGGVEKKTFLLKIESQRMVQS